MVHLLHRFYGVDAPVHPCLTPLAEERHISVIYCMRIITKKYRARQNSKPLGEIRYLWNYSKFFRQIYNPYTEGIRLYTVQISLQYLVEFTSYNYLNLNVHFSK